MSQLRAAMIFKWMLKGNHFFGAIDSCFQHNCVTGIELLTRFTCLLAINDRFGSALKTAWRDAEYTNPRITHCTCQ